MQLTAVVVAVTLAGLTAGGCCFSAKGEQLTSTSGSTATATATRTSTATSTSTISAGSTSSGAVFETVGLTGVLVAGGNHACAIVNGGVQCWGLNSDGQLGNGFAIDSWVPVAVQGLGSGVQAITAGANHSCALVGGSVQCWGWNVNGQLGDNSTTDSEIPVLVAPWDL